MAELNVSQEEAVRFLDGPCLVIAGAGSGKTRVITAKLAHLIQSGFSSRAIAAITFTNKAASEMAERFAASVKIGASDRPTICTFHSLGMRILRSSGKAIGLKNSFSIFDSEDCANLLTQLLATTDRKLVRAAAAKISLWKNALQDPEDAIRQSRDEHDLRIARAFRDYQATLEGYQAVDFDDLIGLPLKLLRQDSTSAVLWRERLRYFLVDEYQDTNAAQYQLLRELVGDRQGFTAVGDDDQSIYGWRGATLENLRRLTDDFPRLKVVKLEQNYRSSRAILTAANALIGHNPKLHPKRLWSALGLGDPIKVVACDDDEHEAETVVMRLQAAKFEKRSAFADFAILYRGNYQARVIEQMLRKEKIPYQISGGQSFFDKAEIRDLCAYLRLLSNEDDDPAFIRAATTPRRGIGAQSLKTLGEYAGARDISLFEAVFETGLDGRMAERQLASLREFGDFINRIKWRATREPAPTVLDDLIKAIDYQAYLSEQGDDRSAAARWQNVSEFCDWIRKRADEDAVAGSDGGSEPASPSSGAKSRTSRRGPLSLVDVAQQVSLITRLEGRENEGDAVRMSTIHAAKGLEYPHVFLVGVEEGLLPHAGRPDDDMAQGEVAAEALAAAEKLQGDRLEEERRLMYVAITRAKRSLTLTWCRQRKRARTQIECQPSRFITEMELELDGSANKPVSSEDAKKRLAALREMFRKD
ncbi:MAG TPA: UvrD-helicase domain-containing protein [Lautropia sp.]|nr:UvrD-helicase domain-containing protein [Lautropia sp.]